MKPKRCPACRLAGRSGWSVVGGGATQVTCLVCGLTGPFRLSLAESVKEWNALSASVKREMKAKEPTDA